MRVQGECAEQVAVIIRDIDVRIVVVCERVVRAQDGNEARRDAELAKLERDTSSIVEFIPRRSG